LRGPGRRMEGMGLDARGAQDVQDPGPARHERVRHELPVAAVRTVL